MKRESERWKMETIKKVRERRWEKVREKKGKKRAKERRGKRERNCKKGKEETK